MNSATIALAFSAGMLAAVNPCGFPLLPAYLSFFVSASDPEAPSGTIQRIGRAIFVSGTLTTAFVAVFGLVGVTFAGITYDLGRVLPWLTMIVGASLVGLGLWGLAGREVTAPALKLQRGGSSGEFRSVFLFGVSYAVSSLSCAIYPFLSIVSASMTREGFVPAATVFCAYAAGMASLVTVLTVSAAVAHQSLVARIRAQRGLISRASSLLIVVVGLYVMYYGLYEWRVTTGVVNGDPVIDAALQIQSQLTAAVDRVRPFRIGAICLVLITLAATVTLRHRGSRRPPDQSVDSPESAVESAEPH